MCSLLEDRGQAICCREVAVDTVHLERVDVHCDAGSTLAESGHYPRTSLHRHRPRALPQRRPERGNREWRAISSAYVIGNLKGESIDRVCEEFHKPMRGGKNGHAGYQPQGDRVTAFHHVRRPFPRRTRSSIVRNTSIAIARSRSTSLPSGAARKRIARRDRITCSSFRVLKKSDLRQRTMGISKKQLEMFRLSAGRLLSADPANGACCIG